MKRFFALLLSLCMLACACVLAEADDAPFVGVWIETEGYGTLTIRLDGSATMVYYDGMAMDTTWSLTENGCRFGDGMWYNSPMELLDENTLSVSNGWMIFAREGFLPTTDEALLLGAEPVGKEGESYFGQWELTNLIMEDEEIDPAFFGLSMTLTFNEDGTAVSNDGWEDYTTTWYVDNGFAIMEFDILYIDEYGQLVFDDEEGTMIFTRVNEDLPDTDDSDEEMLLALLQMMSQMEGNDLSALPEAHQPFVGEWYLCYVATGGLSGDLRTFGVTGTLSLNANYTGLLSGIADEAGDWYEDEEGVIRFGENGMPLYLIGDETDGLFLQYGTEMGGYMIFHQDEAAAWTPGLYPLAGEAPVPPAAADAVPAADAGDGMIRLETRYVCKTYTAAGFIMDAATLGAAYEITFHPDGKADFTMGGVALTGLPYTVDGAYTMDYYGNIFSCVPTAEGFDLDYYGAMTMHFVPAE